MPESEQALADKAEQVVTEMSQQMREGDRKAVPRAANRITSLCGPTRALQLVLSLAGRYLAEKAAFRKAFEAKKNELSSLLAVPRRIAQALGLIFDVDDDGNQRAWAVIEGPPLQACRFAHGVAPEDVCEQEPEEPVWVWLIEASPGEFVVAGRIDPPALLEADGMETEMTFEGFVEEEVENEEQAAV